MIKNFSVDCLVDLKKSHVVIDFHSKDVFVYDNENFKQVGGQPRIYCENCDEEKLIEIYKAGLKIFDASQNVKFDVGTTNSNSKETSSKRRVPCKNL